MTDKFNQALEQDMQGVVPNAGEVFTSQNLPPDSGRLIAKPVEIGLILPDLTQPRRALPAALSYRGTGIEDLLSQWWGLAEEEAGAAIEALHHIKGEETARAQDGASHQPGHIEKAWMDLLELAASIRRDGLINPITIYRIAPEHTAELLYCIETGERRWLAYHLLAWLTDEPQWQSIPARVVDAPNVWRQAQENTARSNLNAIGLARQLALLLLDLYSRDPFNLRFQPYQAFESDREFYAQVADGREFPIPYGEGEKVLAAMGVKSGNQLRQYRALLRVTDDIWTKGDEEGWGIESMLGLARESVNALTHSPQSDNSIIPPSPSPTTDVTTPPASDAVNEDIPESPNMQPAVQESAVDSRILTELKLAYKIGQRSKIGWFAAVALGTAPHLLNNIVELGYLDCKAPGNADYRAAVYRINREGCNALGLAVLEFSEPVRRDPGQSPTDDPLAGTQPQGGVPPVQPRRSKRIFDSNVERQFKLMLSFTDVQAEAPDSRAYVLNMMRKCADIIENAIEELEGDSENTE
jgi:hypothetical protein